MGKPVTGEPRLICQSTSPVFWVESSEAAVDVAAEDEPAGGRDERHGRRPAARGFTASGRLGRDGVHGGAKLVGARRELVTDSERVAALVPSVVASIRAQLLRSLM